MSEGGSPCIVSHCYFQRKKQKEKRKTYVGVGPAKWMMIHTLRACKCASGGVDVKSNGQNLLFPFVFYNGVQFDRQIFLRKVKPERERLETKTLYCLTETKRLTTC